MLGAYNGHLKQIEQRLDVQITHRGDVFISMVILKQWREQKLSYSDCMKKQKCPPQISADQLHMMIQGSQTERDLMDDEGQEHTGLDSIWLQTRKGRINPRGANQNATYNVFCKVIFPLVSALRGQVKPILAVAAAVDMLERNEIQRILLVRPAVEAGEKLGFLPGDLSQKIDPYLRPLYDALYEMLGFEKVAKLIERQVIEVAPLAYMRGRTLNHSFVILDEAQNTTPEQMKMFLTRLGFGSRAVITGDITQVDLPRGQQSGLAHALRVLEPVTEIHITRFHSRDVVRHQLVQKIVEAYEGWDSEQHRIGAEERAARKARHEALVQENDVAADAQHQDA
jgi:phosphate starvation-inducible PhoH-like protein